jgi:hypothetical protein
MTSLLSAKKRAEEFAALVDGSTPAGPHPELDELLGVVSTLRREAGADAQPLPRPEFTASLRELLMAEAATSLAQDNILTLPPRRKGSRERRLALVASSLVLVGGTAGMAAAAQNALPGEALYPVKRGLESAQAELSTSPTGRGEDLLAQADTRLLEVQGLFDRSADLSQVPSTIDEFTAQALEASQLLLEEFEQERDPAIIEELRAFTADNLAELRDLSLSAEPEHQDELAAAAEVLLDIDERALAACPTCAEQLSSLEMPTFFLTANEARDALEAINRVELNNDHPVITTEDTTKKPGKDDPKDDGAPTDEGKGTDEGTGGDDLEEPGDTGGTDEQPDEPGLPDIPAGEVDTNNPGGGGKELGQTVDEGTKGVDENVKDALPPELDPLLNTLSP